MARVAAKPGEKHGALDGARRIARRTATRTALWQPKGSPDDPSRRAGRSAKKGTEPVAKGPAKDTASGSAAAKTRRAKAGLAKPASDKPAAKRSTADKPAPNKPAPKKVASVKRPAPKDAAAPARSPRGGSGNVQDRAPDSGQRASQARARSRSKRFFYGLARALALLILTACFVEVLRLTLTPSPASVGIAHTNLDPGSTIKLYLDQPSVRQAVIQIGGNILIGVPFGLLLPTLYPRTRGLIRVVLLTCLVILLIELAQHYFVAGRSFDVDDIILAAIGAAIGYLPLGRRFGRMVHPDHRHWWQRELERMRARG